MSGVFGTETGENRWARQSCPNRVTQSQMVIQRIAFDGMLPAYTGVMTDKDPCHRRPSKPPSHLRLVDDRDMRSPSRDLHALDANLHDNFDDEAEQPEGSPSSTLQLLQLLVWLTIALYVGAILTAD
ncbi:MAG: hypothetical protein AAFZ38_00810 [Myxococcota bacterium]